MKLIVGLGNPGEKYAKNRHNIGWFVIDEIAKELNVSLDQEGFKGVYAEAELNGEPVLLLKPLTYMNSSGESIKEIMDHYGLSILELLVMYDDMDIEVGNVKLRYKGGTGGHNGIKSIIRELGKEHFNRIRLGISRPAKDVKILDYVLGDFNENEWETINASVVKSKGAALAFVNQPFERVMSQYNK